jgi:hypothetical protein
MFGRVTRLGQQIAEVNWKVLASRIRIETLEKEVADLTKALEWHVGTTLEILLAEERVLKLKIAERKQLIEETGSAQDPKPGGDQSGEARTEVGRA